MPISRRLRRARDPLRPAGDLDPAVEVAQHPEEREQQFALALPVEPAEPDHLAAA